jgi:cellulose synthase/poly-beta-1,6-N-acetylglucosamine synthase-like glycosyltransferase
LWGLARVFGRQGAPAEPPADALPSVSLVLAAYNEEAVLEDRLENALATDYPRDRFEILVGSDGSTDGTGAIACKFADRGVRLLDFPVNRGKASVVNDLASAASGELVIFSDANTHIDPAAARKLARWFADPGVGAVVGQLVLHDPVCGQNVDSTYWRYERFLKQEEDRLGALLGANGAIYAIRRSAYTPIPPGTIVDDFVIPLLAKLRTGLRVVYDKEAVAVEETAPDVRAEFHRRARIGAGGFQAIVLLRGLLSPRHGWTAFAFFSHKILRWLCPFFLIGALLATAPLLDRPLYRAALAAQVAMYAAALILPAIPWRARPLRPLRLSSMFVSMNAALLVGFVRWVRGTQKAGWRRTPRTGEAAR